MLKKDAINKLGGDVTSAAAAIGVTVSAISQWPDVLPARLEDRVLAALWRRSQSDHLPELLQHPDAPKAKEVV